MKKVKVIKVKPVMSIEGADAMAGKYIDNSFVKQLVRGEDTDLIDAESGRVLAKLRVGVIPPPVISEAYSNLLLAARPSMNRGTAGGKGSMYKIRSNGTLSKTLEAIDPIRSGVAGYYDANARMPFCRTTAFTQQHLDKFLKAYPIIKTVDTYYKELMPREYARQRAEADRTSDDFRIKDTAFTTITINKNYQTAVHKDAGDFTGGYGNLVALRNGTFTGGYLTLIRWGVGVDIRNGDLLLMDVHEWHANTPLHFDDPNAIRLSLVMYYRENMVKCGSLKEELQKAKSRKKGDKLYE